MVDVNILVAKPDDIVAVRKYMRRRPRPDAFVCQNDEVAAAFKQTLEKLKLKVPDDVMLVGFDGLEISRLVSPPLTTVRQPFERLRARSSPDCCSEFPTRHCRR